MKRFLAKFLRKPFKWFCRQSKKRQVALIVFICLISFVYWFVPSVWRLREGPITITRWPKAGERQFTIGPGQATWVPINRVSRHILNAFIAAEDGKFYQHNGFDYEAILRSIETNRKSKRIVRGGSTISQQVVKMAFLSNDRNYVRKAREAIGTILLEMMLEKDQILEWYLNLAEFGDGVFGIKAAAKHYFDTKPELLTIQHGAHLALVLPSPNKWSRGLRSKRLTEFGQKRYTNIINNMYLAGMITNVLRMTALATGDFGRPVPAFLRLKQRNKPTEPMNFNDEELESAAAKDEVESDPQLDIKPHATEPLTSATNTDVAVTPEVINPQNAGSAPPADPTLSPLPTPTGPAPAEAPPPTSSVSTDTGESHD